MPTTPNTIGSVIALDVGSKRVGVARASLIARLPEPLMTLEQDDSLFARLHELIKQEGVTAIVVGLPRGLQGQETDQTRATEAFIEELRRHIDLPVYTQDEALTSQKAEAALEEKGSKYQKGDVDALAATYILGDFLSKHPIPSGERTP